MTPRDHGEDAPVLTPAQRRILLGVSEYPKPYAKVMTLEGRQWPAITRLQNLGWLEVEDIYYLMGRERIEVVITEAGKAAAKSLKARHPKVAS